MDDTGEPLEVLVAFISEEEAVFQYRQQELLAAGYSEPDAAWIAQDPSIDLHRAVGLVTDGGCDPGLAARILL